MVIGNNKSEVIKNIEQSTILGNFNSKVELNDPKLSIEEKNTIIKKFLKNRQTRLFKLKTMISKSIIFCLTKILHRDTEIVGIENIKDIEGGAIITCNHFNPLDSLIIQKLANEILGKRLYIISQESNLAMNGILGFFMNYSDIIPITDQVNYMKKEFPQIIKDILEEDNLILIYPEQEMWFNYKKPRPVKKGAYYYASKNNVPIISCFVEMIETSEKDNEEFRKVKYKLHVLNTIYSNQNLPPKQDSDNLSKVDYQQKVEAYEKLYNKKLDYKFEFQDIAGWCQ